MHNKYTQTHLGGVTHTWQSLSQTCIHVRRSFHIPAAERYSTLHNPCDLKISQIPRDLAEPWGDFTLSLCYEGGWLACFRRHLAQSKHSVASFQPALISGKSTSKSRLHSSSRLRCRTLRSNSGRRRLLPIGVSQKTHTHPPPPGEHGRSDRSHGS